MLEFLLEMTIENSTIVLSDIFLLPWKTSGSPLISRNEATPVITVLALELQFFINAKATSAKEANLKQC